MKVVRSKASLAKEAPQRPLDFLLKTLRDPRKKWFERIAAATAAARVTGR